MTPQRRLKARLVVTRTMTSPNMLFLHAESWGTYEAQHKLPDARSGTWTEGQSQDYTNINLMGSRFRVRRKMALSENTVV